MGGAEEFCARESYMGGHVIFQEATSVAGRRADDEERTVWMSFEGTCQSGHLRHSKRRARRTVAGWGTVVFALCIVVGRASSFAPGGFCPPSHAPSKASGTTCASSCPPFPRRFQSLRSLVVAKVKGGAGGSIFGSPHACLYGLPLLINAGRLLRKVARCPPALIDSPGLPNLEQVHCAGQGCPPQRRA